MFFKAKNTSSGLSLEDGGFHLLTIEGGGRNRVLNSSYGKFPDKILPSGDIYENSGAYLSSVFRYVADETGGISSPVNLALPVSEALLRIVNMPDLSLDDARQAFKYEVENYFPFSESECVYDIAEIDFPARQDSSEKRFLVAAARKSLIDNIAHAAASNGIRLASIEPSQIALERAASPDNQADETCVYIYAGIGRSVLVVSWRGCGIFYHNASGFGDAAKQSPESDEYTGAALSFSREVRSSLQFAMSQIRSISAKKAYIFGPGASKQLCETLADWLTLDSIELTDVMRIHGIDFEYDGNGWETALGLALR